MTREEIAQKFVAAFPKESVSTRTDDQGAIYVELTTPGADSPHTQCSFSAESAASAIDKAIDTIKANAA